MASQSQFHYVKAGRIHFFCPLCHHHQSTNSIRRVSVKNIFQLLILTSASTFLAWPFFEMKGISLFFFYWAGFEFFYRLRKRQALICESCGFDPFLYKQDVQKARAALKQHWEKRIQNENLFAGKKLRNYQTNPVNQTAQPVSENGSSGEPQNQSSSLTSPGSP